MKILHLEDNVFKHNSISRVINDICISDIEWVTDVDSGLEKIKDSIEKGDSYDLIITDMHYPLSKGLKPDWEAGEYFLLNMKNLNVNIPIIICSSLNIKNKDIYGCVWYNDKRNWESEMRDLVKKILKEKDNV